MVGCRLPQTLAQEMKKILALILVAFLPSCEKPSLGRNASQPEQLTAERELILPDQIISEIYSEDLRNWLKSLYKGLGYDEARTEEEIFLRCDIEAKGPDGSYTIFQSSRNDKRFFILDIGYVIDFESQEIGTLGVGGISIHHPPSKRMVVLLSPTKGEEFMGVLLGDYKTDSSDPIFSANKVTF
jgi:hypothetical protein